MWQATVSQRILQEKITGDFRIHPITLPTWSKSGIVVEALNKAVSRPGNFAGGVVHSDRCIQCRRIKFRRTLGNYGLVGSLEKIGGARYEATMASFFTGLLNNVCAQQSWVSNEKLWTRIVVWVEKKYHRKFPARP